MTTPTCIKCSKETKSVLDTPAGFTCYSESKDPMKAKRVISHEEDDIQADFFEKVKIFFPTIPSKLIFAVPNGGNRDKHEAARLKRQGVKSGVADA
jgi:hypothetical protein